MISLQGKNLVIVGGGSGIGWAGADLAVRLGARVIVADLDESVALRTSELGANVGFVQCDARHSADTDRLFATADEKLNGIDLVFTTVGGARLGDIESLDADAWSAELAFNLTSAYLVCRSALPYLRRRGGGAIVTTSSGYALLPGPDRIGYTAAKAGVLALTRSLAGTAAPFRVRVNCLVPGPVDTPRFRAMNGGDPGVELVRQRMPLGAIVKPADCANAAMFLLSDAAAQITGQALHVNGGLIMP
jgi:meso-butanediol dehydrogenase/(S,S)-butanediol dehydrogenase/diacetyl reductase